MKLHQIYMRGATKGPDTVEEQEEWCDETSVDCKEMSINEREEMAVDSNKR